MFASVSRKQVINNEHSSQNADITGRETIEIHNTQLLLSHFSVHAIYAVFGKQGSKQRSSLKLWLVLVIVVGIIQCQKGNLTLP